MYRNIKKTFPTDYNANDCIWTPIPCALIPIITGKVAELEFRAEWETDEDWHNAYAAIVRWEADIMACGQKIDDKLERLIAALGYNAGLDPTDPAYDIAHTQRAAIEELQLATQNSDVIQYINQLETFIHTIAEMIGGAGVVPPVD